MKEYCQEEETQEDELTRKKKLLQREIVDGNYNKDQFIDYCQALKPYGDDLSLWSYDELKSAVNSFISYHQQEDLREKEEQQMKNQYQIQRNQMENQMNQINKNIIYNNNIVNNIASNRNSFTKESENDNHFSANKNNQMKKSLSKESESHSYLPWNAENTNAIINKSNNKANLADSFLNLIKQTDKKLNPDNKLTNINEYKKIKKNNNNNTNHVYNEIILQNNEIKNGYIYEQKNEVYKNKSKRINEMVNNKNNLKEKRNGGKAGYNDTIYNKEEPISYREGEKIKGRRRILSTKVHIRGVNSSKNFNNIF